MLRAVCDQLALVLERDRLLRTATDAEIFRQTETGAAQRCSPRSRTTSESSGGDQGVGDGLLDPEVDALGRASVPRCCRWSTRDRPARRARREPAGHVADRGRRAAGSAGARRPRGGRHRRGRRRRGCVGRTFASQWSIDEGHAVAIADPVFLRARAVQPAGQCGQGRRRRRASPTVEVEVGRRPRERCAGARSVDHGEGRDSDHAGGTALPTRSPGSRSGRRTSAPGSGSRSRRGSSI